MLSRSRGTQPSRYTHASSNDNDDDDDDDDAKRQNDVKCQNDVCNRLSHTDSDTLTTIIKH